MTTKQPGWREILSGRQRYLAFIVAVAVQVFVINAVSDRLLVYLIRFIPEVLGKLLLLVPNILLTILVYYLVARITRRFFVSHD